MSFDHGLLHYELPVDINLVGGPIIDYCEGDYFVTGINTNERAGKGGGVEFSSAILAQFNKWLKVH